MQSNSGIFSLLLTLVCLFLVSFEGTSRPKSSQATADNTALKQIETQIKASIPSDWKVTSTRPKSLPFGWGLEISESKSRLYYGYRITVEKPGSKKTSSGDKGQGAQLPRPLAVTIWLIPLSNGLTLQKAIAERGQINTPAQQAIARLVGANSQYLLATYVEYTEEEQVLRAIIKKFKVVTR